MPQQGKPMGVGPGTNGTGSARLNKGTVGNVGGGGKMSKPKAAGPTNSGGGKMGGKKGGMKGY